MTSYLTTIAGSVLNSGSTDLNGLQFNTSTLFHVKVVGIRTTSTGHLIFWSYGSANGGVYVTSLINDGYAYGINMTVGTIYKLVSYGDPGASVPGISATFVRSSPATYADTNVKGPFIYGLTINPVNNDIYFLAIINGQTVNAVYCIPFTSGTNSLSGDSMTAGYVYPLYAFAQAAYTMEFSPDGHLFYSLWPSPQTVGLSGASGDVSLYGITVKKYLSSYGANLTSINSANYIANTSLSTCFDTNKNFYISAYNGTSITRYTPGGATLTINVGQTINTIQIDNLTNLYILTNTGALYATSLGSSTSVMGITVNQYTVTTNLSVTPTLLNSGTKTNTNNGLITNALIGQSAVYSLNFDAYTGLNMFFPGSNAIRKSINPITSSPQYLTVTSTTHKTITIGNLRSSLAFKNPYSGGGPILNYYYSINGGSSYTSFSPQNLTSYSFTVPLAQQYTVLLKNENIIGQSPVYTTNVNVIYVNTVPVSPDSYSLSFDVATGITVSITDTSNVAINQVYYYYYYYRVGDIAPNQSADINVYANSYVPVVNGQTSYSFNIKGLQASYYNIYIAAKNSAGATIYSPVIAPVNVICFKEDSRILTNRGYRKIQYLKKGDLIKTFQHGFKPIYKIGKKDIIHVPSTTERGKDRLYKCSPTEYPEVFEDLVLTGCHSILVDEFVDDEQRNQTKEINGGIYVTDKKYRLPVCVDRRASVYEHAGKYAVYHIALENDDNYMNYGIYANGLLVESTSKRFLDEYQVMETNNT